jgi:hypothetical protein
LWALGVDREFADEARRRTELSNFLDHLTDIDASDRADAASPDLCSA